MARLILLIAALVLVPVEAHAAFLQVISALVANGVGFGAALWAVAGGAITNILGSLLLNAAASALTRKKSTGAAMLRDLAQPTSLPAHRHVFGECMAMGTPAGWTVVGTKYIACYILNSRQSVGPFTVYLDKRAVAVSGDAFDFAGAGAAATAAPFINYARYWIGKGDQTTCPDAVIAEGDGYFQDTDAWRGCTVLWVILDAGPNASRSERWPSAPPEVMVQGKWSLVWDPRNPSQDPNDASTLAWSANQALCALDALRSNQVRPYALASLWLDTWKWAADVADERVGVLGGGTIARYEVNGTLAYSDGSELEDQLEPLMIAGAARFVRARGQLGIVPGCAQDSAMTLTDMLDGEAPNFTRYADRDSLCTSVAGTYLAPDRFYEDATLPTYVIAGAQAEDGGLDQLFQPDLSMITDQRQGQRVQKILAMRKRMQRALSAEFPPEAFDLVAGSWCSTDFAAPFAAWSMLWEVEGCEPVLLPAEGDGVALRCKVSLRETSAAIYAWDYATEEQAVEVYDFDATVAGVNPPTGVSVDMSAANDATEAGVVAPRFRCDFTASASASVTGYEWQLRLDGDDWPSASTTVSAPDGETAITLYGSILSQTALHDFRIRAIGTRGASGWIEVPGLARDFELADVVAAPGIGCVDWTMTAPDNAAFAGVRIYRAAVGAGFDAAVMVTGLTTAEPAAAMSLRSGVAGTNLLANGTFDSATGWTLGAGWSVAAGVATHATGTASTALHAVTIADGATVRWSITAPRWAAGNYVARLSGSTTVSSASIWTGGQHVGTLTAPAGVVSAGVWAASTADLDVDDLVFALPEAGMLAQGQYDFWSVPVMASLVEGTPSGPYTLTII